jgi:hypothetical protein
VNQELALRRGGIHLLGQRTKGDTASLVVGHGGEEMRQRSAKSVQFPDDPAITAAGDAHVPDHWFRVAPIPAPFVVYFLGLKPPDLERHGLTEII